MNKEISSREKKDWDFNARFYDMEANSPFKSILRKEMKEKFLLGKRHKLVLDLGAGMGDFAAYLTEELGIKPTCVDFSRKMREIALEKNPAIVYYLASASKLPFKSLSFDAVIAGGVLHHLKAQGIFNESILEIDRILKPGGYFCYLDRSDLYLARQYENFLSFIKNIFSIINRKYSASSTSSETSLTGVEVKIIRDHFKFISRSSIYSMPFKFLMVVSNFFFYTLGPSFYFGFQKLTYPVAFFFEKYLNFKFWETEYCEVCRKKAL